MEIKILEKACERIVHEQVMKKLDDVQIGEKYYNRDKFEVFVEKEVKSAINKAVNEVVKKAVAETDLKLEAQEVLAKKLDNSTNKLTLSMYVS